MNHTVSENHSSTGYLYSSDQTPLFYRHYAVDGQKATVLLVHGFGEHCGRYMHVIEQLLKRHMEVFCIDFRGHGRSQGPRGDVERFEQYEEDLDAAIKYVLSQKKQGQKLFILAHSMGALVSMRLMAKQGENIAGMVLSAPLFALSSSIPAWKKCGATMLAKVMPTMKFPSGIKGNQLSSDHQLAQAYDDDPLVLKLISVRAFGQIQEGLKGMADLRLKKPFFIQIAGQDSIVDPQAALNWFERVKDEPDDKKLKIYASSLHEIYNEKHREEAINDALTWIEERS